MSIAILKCDFDCFTDLIGFGLPCSKTNAGHFIARVERVDGPVSQSISSYHMWLRKTDLVPLPETEGVTMLAILFVVVLKEL